MLHFYTYVGAVPTHVGGQDIAPGFTVSLDPAQVGVGAPDLLDLGPIDAAVDWDQVRSTLIAQHAATQVVSAAAPTPPATLVPDPAPAAPVAEPTPATTAVPEDGAALTAPTAEE